ncbi:hypothetical protein F8S13_10145 [Chloroflexia bacterium SDU3-3]|nr:hypothetical protein F8S13_10145 [Chloroflexia bacterium SDU3-3]
MNALLSVLLLTAFRLYLFVNQYAVNILFWDQWDFYDPIFNQESLLTLFDRQHGPHKQGLGFIITKYLNDITHWNSRSDSFFIASVVLVAAICFIFLKVRTVKSLHITDFIIPALILNLNQFETFVGTPNVSHSAFALFLISLYALSWTIPNIHLKFIAIVFINFLLIFSGFGFFMGLFTPLLLILMIINKFIRKDHSSFHVYFISLFLCFLSLFSFFAKYNIEQGIGCLAAPESNLGNYVLFVGLMLVHINGTTISALGVAAQIFGFILLLLFIATIIYHGLILLRNDISQHTSSIIILALTSFSMIFALNVSLGRFCMEGAAEASRYVTLLLPGFLGMYLHLLQINVAPPIKHTAVGIYCLFLLPCLIFPFNFNDDLPVNFYAKGKEKWKACYLVLENAEDCDKASGFPIYPNNANTRLDYKLNYLKSNNLNLFLDADSYKEYLYPIQDSNDHDFGPITSDNPLEQDFLSNSNGLKAVYIKLATYNRVNHGNATISLYTADDKLIAQETVDMSVLKDNDFFVLQFPKQNSKNVRYLIKIATDTADPSQTITAWMNKKDVYQQGSIHSKDGKVKGDLAFKLLYEK